MPPNMTEEDEAAEALEATGNYRVLRRVPEFVDRAIPEGVKVRVGLMVDVETTGLDHERDEIIELCAVPFMYGSDGNIYMVSDPVHMLNQPSVPIPEQITEITGLTDDVVFGHKLDLDALDELFGTSNFVVAHHAAFDRRFIERYVPQAAKMPWGCSMEQVPWKAEGWNGRALEYLLMRAGFFYEAHRAEDDCLAAIHLLSLTLPRSGKPVMAALRDTAKAPTRRLYAEGSPFHCKDKMKARGYKWNDGANGRPKSWFIDLEPGAVDAENDWLALEIFGDHISHPIIEIDFYSRFSARE